ncbi:MAG: rhodanese-like domain-containing protein [Erythrobacter sp.]|nr:rhodanese-like domain-containing protein [Erythrobacter sp.]
MEQLIEFAGNHPLLVAAAVVTAALLVYNELRLAGSARFSVSPDQAVRMMNKGALVLDVRSGEAYAQGHLSGARHVALAEIDDKAGDFARYKGKPVLTYCDRGSSSSRAVTALRRHDFEFAFSLRGGLAAWREEHLPIEKSGRKG